MKLSVATLALSLASAAAFAPVDRHVGSTVRLQMSFSGMDLSGNSWKPDSEKSGVSTLSPKHSCHHNIYIYIHIHICLIVIFFLILFPHHYVIAVHGYR
jgi:hypothetical protein